MNIEELFFHHMIEKVDVFKKLECRYVHYTSCSNFMSMLQNKEVWLRNAKLMNDYHEIERGIRAVTNYFGPKTDVANLFWKALDEAHTNISNEIKARYDDLLGDLRNNTYIMSLSVHLDKEDAIGRLSMWRAYASKDGVAIVLKPEAFHREENVLEVFSYPALYWDDTEIDLRFSQTVNSFSENIDLLKSLDFSTVVDLVLEMFTSYAICLKHPGFEEEMEMRIVYRPNNRKSLVTVKRVEIIGTTPQLVHTLPLKEELKTSFNNILDRVILGPSNSIIEISNALYDFMLDEGIDRAGEKIYLSDIPLRT